MIKLKSLVSETMTDAYKYKHTFKTELISKEDEETGEEYQQEVFSPVQIVKFKTDAGIPYIWYAKQNRYDDTMWEIAFGVDKGVNARGANELDINVTNTGDAFKIFATVIDITNSFIQQDENYEIQRLLVKSKGKNRTNLYLKRILPRIEYFEVDHVYSAGGDETEIILVKNQ